MLETLIIKDFQAHTRLRIDFDPHVTTIVGSSDKGKSAIIRALRWLALNQPTGDAFIRDGAAGTHVKLLIDGKSIGRKKTRSKNTYTLNGSDLKSFKSDVPPEIASILNVSEINFQRQHDGPFWFSSTAGEVSRELNQIINLGQIDTILKYLNQEVRTSDSLTSALTITLEATRQRRKDLKQFEAIDTELEGLEGQETALNAIRGEIAALQKLLADGCRSRRQSKGWAKVAVSGQAAIGRGRAWTQALARRADLHALATAVKRLQAAQSRSVPNLEPILGLWRRAEAAREKAKSLRPLINNLRESKAQLENLTNKLQNLQQQKSEIKVCPTCGQQI